jgi:signal transduction histidine kinase
LAYKEKPTILIKRVKQPTIMEQGYALLSQFLSESSKLTTARHRKSIILVFSHFFILTALISLLILSKTIEKVALVPTACAVPAIFASLIYFKKNGFIRSTGNILTIIWYLTLIPILMNTGGLNSSFFPWLYSIIFVMVLVENYLGSTLWFLVASVTSCGFYFAEHFVPSINTSICTNTDSLISYLTVGFFMFVNLAVFKKHQIGVIQTLKEKYSELKNQKKILAEHTAELEKVQKQLKVTNQELQTFAHVASHDLKEPLRMIRMYTQLIEKKLKHTLEVDTQEYMFFIKDGVKRMQLLLDNLLAYSLLGKNTNDIKGINLNITLKKVTQNLTVLIYESNATVHLGHLPIMIASGTEMTQLFQNLIANALKFRKPDTKPDIKIACNETSNELLFSVADNGIGIKKEDQERVFDIFTRLHTNLEFEGTGIGLATCKKIINNLNGKIWLTSTEGVGTTFYFSIPKTETSTKTSEVKTLVVDKIPFVKELDYAI